jgi:hypothetical protein
MSYHGSSNSFWASLAIATARVPGGEVDRGCSTATKVTTTILIISGFSHQPQIVVDGVTNITIIILHRRRIGSSWPTNKRSIKQA